MTREADLVSPYDAIAPVYDRVFEAGLGGREAEADIVARVCRSINPNTSSLIDLGSGTGAVLGLLADELPLEDMAGVEKSQKMVDVARAYIPEADFVQGDITDFDLGRKFDNVTCLFDTINHIPTRKGWEDVFERAAQHLKPGGLFIFDMVTRRQLESIANQGRYTWEFEGGHCTDNWSRVGDNQYRADFEIREYANPKKLTRLSIFETTFPESTVLRSLSKMLDPERTFDFRAVQQRLQGLSPETCEVTENTNRIMMVAQKPPFRS